MKAALRQVRLSPKKANLIAGTVRGKAVNEALGLLKFMPKKGAKILYKVVHSAAYNAKNNFKQNLDDLIITKILVTKGMTYKRSVPISRGRMHPILKRTCHIIVEVGLPEGMAMPTPAAKQEKTKTETPAKSKESATAKASADKKTKAVSKKESSVTEAIADKKPKATPKIKQKSKTAPVTKKK